MIVASPKEKAPRHDHQQGRKCQDLEWSRPQWSVNQAAKHAKRGPLQYCPCAWGVGWEYRLSVQGKGHVQGMTCLNWCVRKEGEVVYAVPFLISTALSWAWVVGSVGEVARRRRRKTRLQSRCRSRRKSSRTTACETSERSGSIEGGGTRVA